jgi:hypothetical protein
MKVVMIVIWLGCFSLSVLLATAQNAKSNASNPLSSKLKTLLPYLVATLPSIRYLLGGGTVLEFAMFASSSIVLTYVLVWAVRKEWA